MRKVVRVLTAAVTTVAMLALPAAAFAGDDGYNTPSGGVAGEQTGGGTLPFTGSELLLYVVVGVAIIASGFALRALAARNES